jgi:hypothetical protein
MGCVPPSRPRASALKDWSRATRRRRYFGVFIFCARPGVKDSAADFEQPGQQLKGALKTRADALPHPPRSLPE